LHDASSLKDDFLSKDASVSNPFCIFKMCSIVNPIFALDAMALQHQQAKMQALIFSF
jgi:hypothetical protein